MTNLLYLALLRFCLDLLARRNRMDALKCSLSAGHHDVRRNEGFKL